MAWWILAGAVVVLAVMVARRKRAQRRTDMLRRRFGPEYDRLVAELGGARAAETRLLEWLKRRKGTELHGLAAGSRADYARRWRNNQASFVDEPQQSVKRAAGLLDDLARARGYPVDDATLYAELLSVDHPRLVGRYRAAQAIEQRGGAPAIDDLRSAFRSYRALFNELLVEGGGAAFVRNDQDVHVRGTT